MTIDNNKEMVAMMKRAKAQIENKIRAAYNAGYRDGLKDGATELINRLAEMSEETK